MVEIRVPVFDNSPSIERILRPISYTSWFMGSIAHPRKCPRVVTIIIRIVHLAVCSVSVLYNVIEHLNFVRLQIGNHFSITYFVNKLMCYVSAYYYICHGIRQYDKWPKLMDKIKELDRKIRRETQINDQPVKRAEVAAILATFVCCPFLLITHTLYCFVYSQNVSASKLLFFYMLAQSLINSFVFDIVVYVLYHRFQAINKLIGQLDKSSTAPWIAFKIRRIRELHADVCDLVVVVNDIYGLYLLLCATNCFITVVTTLFRIYLVVKKTYDNLQYYYISINIVAWILCTTQYGLMCWICTLARQESDKTGIIMCAVALKCKSVNYDILHETGIQSGLEMQFEDLNNKQTFNWSHSLSYVIIENLRNLDRDCVRSEIKDFSIQLQHSRVAFTACNFFEISNAVFCGFIGMIITYLTISIQFSD
ncbi:uncharacterized protein LOC105832706 isoform X2 [Monomorium pharaonis]|uniref:uncharacterized protein LOC105832706 isoform X2 n=1 Tax=Monomorium pharaonis TaxID=307658 RepID=UPI0017466C1F|nr:uncharacterized protein LOC105832706 isoform X2 [Monomorium pharaonis]